MRTRDVNGKRVKLQIWDTAGQERFKPVIQTYYRAATGIMFTYSVEARETFENIERWMKHVKQHASEDICMILIGNKSDTPNREVLYEEGKSLADSYGMQFFETSAKNNLNVQEAFKCLVKEVMEKLKRIEAVDEKSNGTIVQDSESLIRPKPSFHSAVLAKFWNFFQT